MKWASPELLRAVVKQNGIREDSVGSCGASELPVGSARSKLGLALTNSGQDFVTNIGPVLGVHLTNLCADVHRFGSGGRSFATNKQCGHLVSKGVPELLTAWLEVVFHHDARGAMTSDFLHEFEWDAWFERQLHPRHAKE